MNHWRQKFHWNLSLHNDCNEFLKALIFFFFTPRALSRYSITTQVAEKLIFFFLNTLSFTAYAEQNLTASEINLFPMQTLEELKQSWLVL